MNIDAGRSGGDGSLNLGLISTLDLYGIPCI